jgi:hypothetical protein
MRATRGYLGTSNVLGDSTYKLGSNVLILPPDDLVCTILADTIAREEQDEFIQNLETIDMNPHAFGGNIGNEAVARRNANPELDRCQPSEDVSRGVASFLNVHRTHDARLPVTARA